MELSQIGLLLAKVETTYGTDATPDSTNNNIAIARGLIPVEPDGEVQDRNILDGGFSQVGGVLTLPRMMFKLRCELRGNRTDGSAADISAGASGNAININPLLRACDLEPTYVAESSGGARDGMVIYQPTIPSAEGTSLSMWAYSQNKLYKATGCKGTVDGISLQAGKFAFIDFTFMGLFASISDSSIPASPTFLATKPPTWENPRAWTAQSVTADAGTDAITLASHGLFNGDRVKFGGTPPAPLATGTWYYVVSRAANTFKVAATLNGSAINLTDAGTTPTLTSACGALFDGWDGPVVSRANFKLGQAVTMREDGCANNGVRGFVISDRQSSGDLDPESVAEATHPLWTDWRSRRNKPLRITVGTLTGNRYAIEAKTAIDKLAYEDRSGRRIQGVQFSLRNADPGEAAGSEFKLFFQ